MTKALVIEPEKVLSPGVVHFPDIPVNAYQKTIDQERSLYSADDFLAIWSDMCAIREFETVLNELKPGLDERLYENALVIELAARGLSAEQQRRYPVYYRGHFIGQLVPDPIVNGTVIVDPKVVSAFNESHLAQMLGYLNITGLEVALLLNFKEAKLAWKRVVRGPAEAETGS